jgi:hypothetical protein
VVVIEIDARLEHEGARAQHGTEAENHPRVGCLGVAARRLAGELDVPGRIEIGVGDGGDAIDEKERPVAARAPRL